VLSGHYRLENLKECQQRNTPNRKYYNDPFPIAEHLSTPIPFMTHMHKPYCLLLYLCSGQGVQVLFIRPSASRDPQNSSTQCDCDLCKLNSKSCSLESIIFMLSTANACFTLYRAECFVSCKFDITTYPFHICHIDADIRDACDMACRLQLATYGNCNSKSHKNECMIPC